MNNESLKGDLNEAVGKGKEEAGKALGKEELQAKGREQEMKGKAQKGAGEVENKVNEAGQNIKQNINRSA